MRRVSALISPRGGSSGAAADDDADDAFEAAPVEIMPKEINLTGEADDKLPNTLVVTVIQARHLHSAALRSTLSCYAKLSSLGREFKTSVITKSDEPYWNETFSFRALDWASSVTLSVRDKINVKMRFLGQVRIACADVAALPGMATQSWFRLRDKNWERKPGFESEIELKIALVYTKRNDPNVLKELGVVAGRDVDDEIVGIVVDQDDETEEEAYARRKELERLENERNNTMYVNLKQGDYQVQVHVIEARDLKGENLSGTSDPYVQAEVLGVKKKTSTKYETLGCVFDEILFFHFKNIGRNELKHAGIKLSIYDKETMMKDNLIGAYLLDCLSVYFRPHHELYRQWVAVHDHLNNKDHGIQGYLLVSVTVIGPGDTFLVHDREAEIARELAAASAAMSDDPRSRNGSSSAALGAVNPEGQTLVLLPPTIDLKLHFLIVKVYKAEDLPAMDQGGLIMASGIDAIVQIGFGATVACKSSVVTVKGSAHLAPEFLEELWIPVMAPTLCRHIAISVWDRDLGRKDELVAVTAHDYQQVPLATAPGGILSTKETHSKRTSDLEVVESGLATSTTALDDGGSVEPRWFNLYGPPLKRTNKKRAILAAHNPDLYASTYRGRVLLSMERVEVPMPEENDKFHVKHMAESSMAMVDPSRLPKTLKYVLRCALFCGTDLPQTLPSIASAATVLNRFRVSISIGPFEILFESLTVGKDGCINWEECKERWPIILPADLTQLPDIIVTLSRQVDKDAFVGVSYARFPAAEYFQQHFQGKCQWVQLREDISRRQTRFALDKSQSPGTLLLRLVFGREEVAVRTPWGDEASLFSSFRHHRVHREIRVHVFQFRKLLLPQGKLKTPSPFVSVQCCGQTKKTASRFKTLDPLFYETLVFVVHVPHDVTYSPDIIFYVQDANISVSIASLSLPGAVLGELRIPMARAQRAVANASPARPAWYPVTGRSGASPSSPFIDEPHGEALISIQYVDHQGPVLNIFPPDPKALQPEYEEANLEIVALGVRKLKASNLLGIRNPQIEFELTGALFVDGSNTRRTKPAMSTTGANGKNANLLERLVLPAKLPVDTLYAPQLTIKVIETTMGGLRSTVLASCSVDLATKMPWSSEYIPQLPQQQAFENPNTGSIATTGVDLGSTQGATRRKSALDLLGLGRWRRKSQHQPTTQSLQASDDPLSGDDDHAVLSDDDYGDEPGIGAPPAEEIQPSEPDDGIGIGDLVVTCTQLPICTSAAKTVNDPAIQDQIAREEQRRYLAGRSDMLNGHGAGAQSIAGLADSEQTGDGSASHASTSPYLQGRDWWIRQGGEELETYLKGRALETYPLYRSVLSRPSLLKRRRARVQVKAGVFKGVITVTEKKKRSEASSPSSFVDLDRLKEPQALVVRVYVLRGVNLQAKDLNGFSDPYLRLKLGKEIQSDRVNYKKKTLNPDFFKVFTFNTTLPGASQLEIGVWDHDLIKKDDFIGSTTIDLEDRWFHREWQRLGASSAESAPLKPIEYRHLYTPKRSTSQGVLQLWVDILTAQQAAMLPPVSIEPPQPKKFEVRVVIWRAENVTDKDESEVNDYFVKVWMEGRKPETTDVHWRCSSGKPCWNWRFKFPVEYPLRTAEFARLHIQLWDKDVIKWNDVIGEAQLDLYKWLRRAYETNRSVSPFFELKQLAKTKPHGETASPVHQVNEEDHQDDEEDDSDDDDEDDDEEELARGIGTRENHMLLRRKQKTSKTRSMGVMVAKPKFMDKDAKQRDKENKKKTKQARESNEARLALNGLLDFIGMGNLPDDAEWITIHYTDRESAISMDMGRIGVTVEIVPEKEAQLNPVGKGQEAPNVNPYLPPPVGRMRLTANPLMMLKELVGPKMCLRIALACCCVGCVSFFGVFGATIMSTLTFYAELTRDSQAKGGPYELPNYPYAFMNASTSGGNVTSP